MFEKLVIFLVIFFAALFQLSLFPNLFFWGVGPNLMLILVIFWTTHEGFEGAFFKIIFTGFMFDIFSFQPVGVSIFIFTIIAFLADSFIKRFFGCGEKLAHSHFDFSHNGKYHNLRVDALRAFQNKRLFQTGRD